MNIATIGIDVANNVFQLHGVNGHGKVALRRQIHRGQMRGLFVNLPTEGAAAWPWRYRLTARPPFDRS